MRFAIDTVDDSGNDRLYIGTPLHVTEDKLHLKLRDGEVKLDYPIVYVRAPRDAKRKMMFAEANLPVWMDPGADLVVLHPDGKEVVLVSGGEDGSVGDPFVSFDGEWVYYAHFRSIRNLRADSSDLYKVHVQSKKVVRLTRQE